jgi:hypothetical protein
MLTCLFVHAQIPGQAIGVRPPKSTLHSTKYNLRYEHPLTSFKYIVEYVTCKTCRSPNTELNKGENRLYFITCNSCGSRRSVAAIKTGFRSQVGRRKRVG